MLILYSFMMNIVLLLMLTLMIACLTLVERKMLSLMQRRVGPDFVGYSGSLQYIADALKLFMKGAMMPYESNKFWFVCIPAFTLTVSYSFWLNAVWGPSIAIFEVEYNLMYSSIFSALFTFCMMLTGFFSSNKYSLLASMRAGLGMLNLELFLGLFFLTLIVIGESFSMLTYVNYQEIYWLFLPLVLVMGLIAITFLLEVNSTPFDLSEAESELVAGYTTEYGGFLFGVYYLGEYLHLFFFSLLVSSLIFGGWELPRFFITPILNYYNITIELPFDMFDILHNIMNNNIEFYNSQNTFMAVINTYILNMLNMYNFVFVYIVTVLTELIEPYYYTYVYLTLLVESLLEFADSLLDPMSITWFYFTEVFLR